MWAVAPLFAQDYYTSADFDIKLSKPHRVVDATTKLYLNDEDHILSFKIVKTNNFIIQSFDPHTLDEISRAENNLERNSDFEAFVRTDKQFYVLYTLYDKPNNTEQLFAQEIDPSSSKFKGKPKKLLDVKGKIAGVFQGGFSFYVSDKFDFQHSKSENKLLIHFRMKPEKRNDKLSYDRIGLYVFDAGLNKIWGDIREMKYTEAQMDIEDYAVDDAGNAYLLGKIYKDGNKDQKRLGDEEINYKYEIMKLTGSDEIAEFNELKLDDNRFIEDLEIKEQDENKMIIAGYYSNAERLVINGVFVFIVDKNTGEHKKNYYDIPLDVLNAYESRRVVKKNTKRDDNDDGIGFANLKLRDIFIDDDGNITLIGEQYWMRKTGNTSVMPGITAHGMQGNISRVYYYTNILVTKVTPEGELAWMTKIPKSQIGVTGMGGMSYSKIGTDKHLYVMYLDNEKNSNLAIDEKPKKHNDGQGGFLTSSKINYETGQVSKESLFDLRNVNGTEVYQFATGRVINLSDEKIAIEVYKKKNEDIWIKVGLN